MKKLKLISLALLFCTALVAADDPNIKTAGNFNGRVWKAMSQVQKMGYVYGFYDGAGIAQESMAKWNADFPISCTWVELVEGIDEIYRQPENAALPIFVSLEVFALKLKGASAARIEFQLSERRKWVSALAENPATKFTPPAFSTQKDLNPDTFMQEQAKQKGK